MIYVYEYYVLYFDWIQEARLVVVNNVNCKQFVGGQQWAIYDEEIKSIFLYNHV